MTRRQQFIFLLKPPRRPRARLIWPGSLCQWEPRFRFADRDDRAYRLSLRPAQGLDTSVKVNVNGSVRLGLPGSSPVQLDVASPKAIVLQSGSRGLDLDVTFPGGADQSLSPNITVRDLLFSRVDESRGLTRSVVRQASTVIAGTLYFESLNGQERKLRPGEAIRIAMAEGELRTLELRDDAIMLKFGGRVRGMSTGPEEHPRSLMPTYLEWLKANQAVVLLWSATLYVFGLITAVLRWWRGPI
jgi:hypothetical protein